MKSPPGRFVIFDVDGTLVDSRPAIVASVRHVQTRRGLKPSESDELRWALGPPLADVMRRLLPGADDAAIAEAVATYREHNALVCTTKATLYEGIRSALAELAASGYTLFVASTKIETVVRQLVDHFELSSYFAGVYGSDADGRYADKAHLISQVLQVHGLNPAGAVMVGDREYDVHGARTNGIRSVAVTYGYGTEQELADAGADALCAHPNALPAALEGIFSTVVTPAPHRYS